MNRHVDPAAHPLDQVSGRLGRCHAERVDDDRFACARLDRGLVDALEEAQLGARAVHAEVRDRDVVLHGEGNGFADALEHHVGLDAVGRELEG